MTLSGSIDADFHVDFDGITFNIHRDVYMDINRFKIGDMIETAEGNIGLILSEDGCDKQGFVRYQVMINGGKYMYSALEMYPLEKK
jgi:hypothetical protein